MIPVAVAVAAVVVAVVLLVIASGPSSPPSTGSGPVPGAYGDFPNGSYTGHGVGIQTITFTVDDSLTAVTGLHGVLVLHCASSGGSSSSLMKFTDPDRIPIGSTGAFSDTYTFPVQVGGKATLTVSGQLQGTGGSGSLQFAEAYCGTPHDPWSASAHG